MRICVFSGTTEGHELSRFLAANGVPAEVFVATEYGAAVMEPMPGITVHEGRLDEEEIASLLDGVSRYWKHQTLAQLKEAVGHIDMMVTGASAITPSGIRFGKGHGYFDLEYAMLSTVGLCDETTAIVGAGHDVQVVDVDVTVEDYDTAIDYIVTPTRLIETRHEYPRPSKGIIWSRLAPGMREQIPPIQELWCKVHCK